MVDSKSLRWRIFWVGVSVLFLAGFAVAIVLDAYFPVPPGEEGAPLMVGFVLWPILGMWFVVWRVSIR